MSRSSKRRSLSFNDEQPKFTTPHMLTSKRTEKKMRLNRMSANRSGRRRRREFNSGQLTVAILAVTLIFLLIFMSWMLFHKNAQSVKIDNEQFAYIKDVNTTTEEFNQLILAKLKEKTGNNVQLNETVTLTPVHVSRKKVDSNTENIITSLCNKLTYKQEAAVITVNGEEKAVLANKEEAQSLLDQILAIYKPADDKDVVKVDFVDEVKIDSKFVEEGEVMTTVKASDILRSSTTEAKTYTVQSGDSFSGIADMAEMTEAELLAANPTITKDTMHKLKIGQQINITVPVPVLSAKIIKAEKEEQDIEIPEKIVENNKEYTTYRKVLSEGKKGKKEVVTHVTYVNGYEESREVASETIITEAQPRTVEVGTLKTN